MLTILERLRPKSKPLRISTGRRYPEIRELGNFARSLPPGQRAEGIRKVLMENGYEEQRIWFQTPEKYREQ